MDSGGAPRIYPQKAWLHQSVLVAAPRSKDCVAYAKRIMILAFKSGCFAENWHRDPLKCGIEDNVRGVIFSAGFHRPDGGNSQM
jgi:hypothetical protein